MVSKCLVKSLGLFARTAKKIKRWHCAMIHNPKTQDAEVGEFQIRLNYTVRYCLKQNFKN